MYDNDIPVTIIDGSKLVKIMGKIIKIASGIREIPAILLKLGELNTFLRRGLPCFFK
jgi:hypothetical protein